MNVIFIIQMENSYFPDTLFSPWNSHEYKMLPYVQSTRNKNDWNDNMKMIEMHNVF